MKKARILTLFFQHFQHPYHYHHINFKKKKIEIIIIVISFQFSVISFQGSYSVRWEEGRASPARCAGETPTIPAKTNGDFFQFRV